MQEVSLPKMYLRVKYGGGVPAKFICKVEDYHEKLLIHMKQFEINFSKYNVNKKQEIIRAYEK